jgi:flagellar hook-associated protein 1 FlgK
MSLSGALSIASVSLANITGQLGLVSNNVANASTPDYSTETSNQESLLAGSMPMGAQSEAATRVINLALQQSLFQQDTTVSGLTTTTNSLQSINAVLGTPGQGNDLSSLLGDVQSAFSTLLNDPSSAAQQSAVVLAAGNLTNGINTLSDTYTQQRQAAQTDIGSAITNMNTDLSQIGTLNNQIIAAQIAGQSTADLDNERDASVHALSGILGIKTLTQPNGGLIVTTTSGTELPTQAGTSPVQTAVASIGPEGTYANGAIPPITLGGIDITNQIQGGQLGADITLRDSTIPAFQSELDEFSYSLASRFQAQGLTLFSDPNGNVPSGGGTPVQSSYVGFASEIQVNPTVAATPSLVRDGTQNVAGSPTGASAFTTNPAGGPAGFAALINRVLNNAFGSQAQSGVTQPAVSTSGLGPDGTLNSPYGAPSTLADNATALVSAQSAVSAAATSQLTDEQAVQTTLAANMTAVSGVNMDSQMSLMIELENAYGANARVISTVQAMFTQLLTVVQ